MIKNQEPETPPSPLHLPPPPPWSSERARCELARSSVLGIFIMIIVTIIKHGDYFKYCFLFNQDVCISVLLPSRAKIHPPRERGRGSAGTPAWEWTRWWVIHYWGSPYICHFFSTNIICDICDKYELYTEAQEVTLKNVYFPMWILTNIHISMSSPQPRSASEFRSSFLKISKTTIKLVYPAHSAFTDNWVV